MSLFSLHSHASPRMLLWLPTSRTITYLVSSSDRFTAHGRFVAECSLPQGTKFRSFNNWVSPLKEKQTGWYRRAARGVKLRRRGQSTTGRAAQVLGHSFAMRPGKGSISNGSSQSADCHRTMSPWCGSVASHGPKNHRNSTNCFVAVAKANGLL